MTPIPILSITLQSVVRRLARVAAGAALAGAAALPAAERAGPFTPEIAEFARNYKPGGQDFSGQGRVLPAEETARRMKLAAGYAVELVASEPVVRQPLELKFDARGRLWVAEYLQYPFPAGLTITAYDQYIRAEYDRTSPPPPRHFRGADRITILEDKNGDGTFETHRRFLEGLNLATSVLPANDGAWVMMAPYLLFYPDRDGDDVPDGDPEVHLAGFGLEDTHSLANSLHWGPDGWIYGAKGSTTTLEIQGVRLAGQCIWRYHPGRRVFEIFAEGGGNTFSCEFDQYGRLFSGTNTGGTRGLHYIQGATYAKGWTKHGPAMNPFIFGFFEHMAHQGYPARFAQAFVIYEDDTMPALRGQFVAAMAMTNRIQPSRLVPDTSTFRTVDEPELLSTEDRAFRPVDVEQGPDGAIYLADWSDLRLSHLNPADTWDKSNGRIFRIVPAGAKPVAPVDFTRRSTDELVAQLAHPNREWREHARRLLAARPEPLAARLRTLAAGEMPTALEAFWVLNLRGELLPSDRLAALRHASPHLRSWGVRLTGDANLAEPALAAELAALAARETDVAVRAQLAATAKRLPAGQALPIVRALLNHDADAADKHLPLLLWWALESKADTGREELLALAAEPAVWQRPLFRQHLAARLGQRFTADQGPRRYYTFKEGSFSEWQIERAPEHLRRNLEFGARLLAAAPDAAAATLLLQGMAAGLNGAAVADVPRRLAEELAQRWASGPHPMALVVLGARLGVKGATAEAVARVAGGKLTEAEIVAALDLFAATAPAEALPVVAQLVRSERNEARRAKRLATLGGFAGAEAAAVVMEVYATLPARLQATAQRMLCEKPTWALALLERMNAGTFDPGALSTGNLARLRAYREPQLATLVGRWEANQSGDPAQRLAQELFERGRTAYTLTCAPCHQEAGEGRAGLAPALVGSPWLGRDPAALIQIVLHGKESPGRGFVMPPWKQFDDANLAAIHTFVRREFGNQRVPVTAEQVAQARAATADRQKAWNDAELKAEFAVPAP